GGTEMGQGLHTKMLTVCAHELGVPKDRVRVMTTATDKVPNTSATAASSGSDLNGAAVRDACVAVRERMKLVAAELLGAPGPDSVRFQDGRVFVEGAQEHCVDFAQVALECWLRQISLSATGFYRTPGIAYDEAKGQGTPFYYFAYGASVLEVELNGLTGEHRLLRADILHDVGDSLIPSIDRGQVEGAFLQGYGWLTCEECLWDADGRATTVGPSTYKVPAVGEAPLDFRVELLPEAAQEGVIHGSKAVGEPPFIHGIAAITALRHAIQGFGEGEVTLELPASPEHLLRAIEAQRGD
ncbi:MAG: molybdopterin-dependent oxidoreductase, partial [Myxococcales bacterium]|nr:molybdopterin-dependent oxidoreductase [Myxococcales bacterium]